MSTNRFKIINIIGTIKFSGFIFRFVLDFLNFLSFLGLQTDFLLLISNYFCILVFLSQSFSFSLFSGIEILFSFNEQSKN